MGRRPQPLIGELRALSDRMRVVAREQGGVINVGQARGLGADDSSIRRLHGSGEWTRIRRGVYADALLGALPGGALPAGGAEHARRCAAVLAGLRGTGAVVSHGSAVRLLGLPLPPYVDPRVSITRRPPAPAHGPRRAGGIEVATHVAAYRDADVTLVAGVPVLTGARLVLDCCDVMPPDSALAVADAALFRRITTGTGLAAEAQLRTGRPGARRARLVAARADSGGRNWFESMSRWWLLEAGLPRPELQVCFRDLSGQVRAEVDFWFPELQVVGEADGAGKYDKPGSLFAEKQREDWLRDAHRVEVARWVPNEMRTPAGRSEVVARLTRAAARCRRAG